MVILQVIQKAGVSPVTAPKSSRATPRYAVVTLSRFAVPLSPSLVTLSPLPVILSEAKDLALFLRITFAKNLLLLTRVAHTLFLMYAPQEHLRHLRLSAACPEFLTAAEHRRRCRRHPRCGLSWASNPVGGNPRLRRSLCGKASPFRGTCVPNNFLRAGWKAQPSSLRGGGEKRLRRPESQRLSAQRAAEPRGPLEEFANLDSPGFAPSRSGKARAQPPTLKLRRLKQAMADEADFGVGSAPLGTCVIVDGAVCCFIVGANGVRPTQFGGINTRRCRKGGILVRPVLPARAGSGGRRG
jgi:hypothetical protein